MKLLLVNKYVHLTGGADQHVLGLASGLRERGHEIRFLSTSSDKNRESEGEFVTTTVTHGNRDDLSSKGQLTVLQSALWNAEAAAATERLVDSWRPDVVHVHKLYPQLSVAPIVVARRRGIPVVQTLHDFEMLGASNIDVRGSWWDRDEPRLRHKLLNTLTVPVHRYVHAQRVDRYVAVSRFVARVHRARGMDATVLPNFVPPESLASAPLGFGDRDGVLFLGRLRPEKGVADVVELARLLPQTRVTVVGSGDLAEWLRQQALSLPNLEVAGFVADPELASLLRRARVVVVPSRCQDAGPLVPLEAMAAGTPVVAYAVGGLAEYVADARGGRVVPSDPMSLATAAGDLVGDEEQWTYHSSHARRAVEERHTLGGYVDRLEGLYEEVIR